MKIIKSVDKKIGDTTYYKYKINLPKKIIEDNKLLDKNFEIEFKDKKIILEIRKN